MPNLSGGLLSLARYANTVTDGVFWITMVSVIYLVSFIPVLKRGEDLSNPLIGSSAGCFLISTFLFSLSLVSEGFLFALLGLILIGVVLKTR